MAAVLDGPTIAWRTDGWDLVAWWSGDLDPEELVAGLDLVGKLIDALPTFVGNGYGTRPAAGPPGPPTQTYPLAAARLTPGPHDGTPPAGWYLDPEDRSSVRYWNGFAWTALKERIPDEPKT
jgi:Protein of unknown function (DUF2510)